MNEDKRALYWINELNASSKRLHDWHKRGDQIIKRYRDERDEHNQAKRINILWSNTELLKPSLYSKPPKPNVRRRFIETGSPERDKLAKDTAVMMEKALDFHVEAFSFNTVAEECVEDFLLPGLATARVHYEPTMLEKSIKMRCEACDDGYVTESGEKIEEDDLLSDDEGFYAESSYEEVVFEEAEVRYIPWKRFRYGKAERWSEVPWVAFGEPMDRKELVERFGDIGYDIPLEDEDNEKDGPKKATVWEIWDKRHKKVCWVCTDYKKGVIEEGEPPLKLRNFFPCPEPLIASKTNNSLIPVPDFTQYQDQADELDELTGRISTLVEALRVIGVYDASAESLGNMLQGSDNTMVPVENWSMFADKGGVRGQVDWFPIDQVANVLISLYEARERTKQELYEVSGLSDILRGQVDPKEKATQSRIKAQFGSLRLNKKQGKVSKFLRDLLALQAEVISEEFSPQTLMLMTGMQVTPQMQQILESDVLREFHIDIETDSTIQPDDQAEKESRTEFLTMAGGFLEKALPIAQADPTLKPLLAEMLRFAVGGFKAGRPLEEAFDDFISGFSGQSGMIPAQQAQQQVQQIQMQAQQQIQALQAQLQKVTQEHQKMGMDNQNDLQKAQIDANTDIEVAKINAAADMQIAQIKP